MANQWLRLWHEMPNDPKWRTIARISKQPIALVQAVYIHLIVDASQNVTRGHIDVTTEDLASALDVSDDDIQSVLDAMQGRVLEGDMVTGWDSRQPKREDIGNPETGAMSAAERKRLQRSREKAANVTNVTNVTKSVTMSQKCHENENTERDIFPENNPDLHSQVFDNKDLSRMSRNVTTDKDKDKDKEITTILSGAENETTDDDRNDAMRWVDFFVNKHGFQFHEAQNATTVPMFVNWVKQGVKDADVELAMITAHHKLGGERPSNPTYYKQFVAKVILEKQKSQNDPQRSNSGLPHNTTKGGNNYERKQKISPDAWRDTNF